MQQTFSRKIVFEHSGEFAKSLLRWGGYSPQISSLMTAASYLIPNFGSKFHCFHEEHAIARPKKSAKISVGVRCYMMSEVRFLQLLTRAVVHCDSSLASCCIPSDFQDQLCMLFFILYFTAIFHSIALVCLDGSGVQGSRDAQKCCNSQSFK